jgi:hypothetical protein
MLYADIICRWLVIGVAGQSCPTENATRRSWYLESRAKKVQSDDCFLAFYHAISNVSFMANPMATNYFDHLVPGLKEAAEVCPGL